jgi:hypothetical protein
LQAVFLPDAHAKKIQFFFVPFILFANVVAKTPTPTAPLHAVSYSQPRAAFYSKPKHSSARVAFFPIEHHGGNMVLPDHLPHPPPRAL